MVLYVNTLYKNLSYICATLFHKWVYKNTKVWYNKAWKGGKTVRPKVYENGRLRYRTLNLRLTEAERKFIFDAAKQIKVPASSLVRTATIKCCEEINGEQFKEEQHGSNNKHIYPVV